MNSLSELNGYVSSLELPFTDLRATDVTFDRETATNQSVIVDEGFTFSTTVGIEIVEIYNATSAAVKYTIDVSNLSGAEVDWGVLPDGVTLFEPSSGVYELTGINNKVTWDAVKVATVSMPANYNGLWTITNTIEYYSANDGDQTRSWTTAVTVNDVVFLTTPAGAEYDISAVTLITNTPQIINVDASYPGATWTITITPNTILSIDTFTSSGTGGTFSVNATTKVVTIVGTRTQVNSHLAGLSIDSNAIATDFNLSYNLSNSVNGTTDSAIQALSNGDLTILGSVTSPIAYFIEDAESTDVDGMPLVSDSYYDGSGTYTYTITPSSTLAVELMETVGATGTSSFNNTTKVLTLTGTRTQVNNRLATLTIKLVNDWAATITLTYAVVTPRNETATKSQSLVCGSNDTEVTNMNISRAYTANNSNAIFFENTPYISDFDSSDSTYTISFSSSIGLFGFGTETPDTTITFSGTKSQCNDKIASIKFYPTAGVSSNGTFTYIQLKNGTQQVSQSVGLTGSSGSYTSGRTLHFVTGQYWTPEPADALYGKISNILVIGGGGGGGGGKILGPYTFGGGGGGGGGVTYSTTPINLTLANSYSIVIGAGGVAGSNGSNGGNGGTTTAFGFSVVGGNGGIGGDTTGSQGGSSGPGVGSSYQDDSGTAGGTAYSTGSNVRNGGGGGGHLTLNGTTNKNATATAGGRGSYGFDEPDGANSYWGAGGGGGGLTGGNSGMNPVSGIGASSSANSQAGTLSLNGVYYGGGGGGGGFGSYTASNGGGGYVRIKLVAK